MKAVVQLNCEHQTCMECFTTYLKTAFTENQFRFFPQNGYTVGCPVYGCSGCVVDTHCFYLLGKSGYEDYQRQAVERLVSMEQDGLFCPRTHCGAAFFWDFSPPDFIVTCPECEHSFCAICRYEKCICSETTATEETIERTCRKCPSCGAPTEKSGGCSHMHCIQCNSHWCYLCRKPWSNECQWDHWFD
ncbi:unnamed protein product [Gongylonema pulchrum]|uniref:RBR-type E3 ubiquitin transferase n=1 Tax=Gongylonema pulchrum TaxID=637853 RepID=A0A183CYZ8_9BILA|nr:unnamed protein product [Gongylonema pulchrum]